MILSTHFSTIDSNTFASIVVSVIGLMPFSIDSCGRFLGNGMTVAVFHNFGSTPSRRELLNIDVTGPDSCCAKSVTIHGGILSGPVAMFILKFASVASVTFTLIVYWTGKGSLTSNIECHACNLGKSSLTDTKNSFMDQTAHIAPLPVLASRCCPHKIFP